MRLKLSRIFNGFAKRGNKSYSWNIDTLDEANGFLNKRYAILESEIRKDANAIGLEPAIGSLYSLAQRNVL